MLILKIAVPVPLNRLFDYLAPDNISHISVGTRVLVPFGKSTKVGFVIENTTNSDITNERLKKIIEILDESSLINEKDFQLLKWASCYYHYSLINEKDFQLLKWASCYYHYPLGEVFSAAFPVSLRKGKKAILTQEKHYKLSAKGECLNPDQLKRSPKQQQIITLFQPPTKSLSVSALNQTVKNWRPAIKALVDKDLLKEELQTKTQANTITATITRD
jgi:primosomal protein N' (replication factor Y)